MAVLTGLVLVSGCKLNDTVTTVSLVENLQDEDPALRIEAIHQAGETKNHKAVPFLIDRLSDSEQEVRMFAIISLEKITSRRMGYEYYAPVHQRTQAIERWRTWQKQNALKPKPIK